MQLRLMLLVLSVVCSCAHSDSDIMDNIKKTVSGNSQTGLDVNVGSDSAKVGVKYVDTTFYYEECSAGISQSGFTAGCERKWKPLFYGLIAGGGVLVLLLLTCCCCCCCCPKERRPPSYMSMQANRSMSTVILVNSPAPNPISPAPAPPKYDAQMLQA